MKKLKYHGKTKIEKSTIIHGFYINVRVCAKEQYPFPVLFIEIYYQSHYCNIRTGNLFVIDDTHLSSDIQKSLYRYTDAVFKIFQTEKFSLILQNDIIPWIIEQFPYMVQKSQRKLFNRTGI